MSIKDHILSAFVGLIVTIILSVAFIGFGYEAFSAEWWVISLITFYVSFVTVHILYRTLLTPNISPPQVPQTVSSFDSAIRDSKYNFIALSSKDIALWRCPTFLYYLTLNEIKSIVEFNIKNQTCTLEFSNHPQDKREFYEKGWDIIESIGNGEIPTEFFGLRLLVYPKETYEEHNPDIKSLIQTHASGHIYCIPIIRDELIKILNERDRRKLEKFASRMDQSITDEYPDVSRLGKIALYYKRRNSEHPFSCRIPDFLTINYGSEKDEDVWWFKENRANHSKEYTEEAEKVFQLLCETITEEKQELMWDEYTPSLFNMVPIAKPIEGLEVDFFSLEFFSNWLNKVKTEPRFNPIGNWLKNEERALKDFATNKSEDIDKALDVGCGFGRHLEILLENGIDEVAGVDNSSGMFKKAQKLYTKYNDDCNIQLRLEDAQDLDFPDNYFDLVICMSNTFGNLETEKTLEDNTKKQKVLKEIKRTLKSTGKLIISVYRDTPKAYRLRKESYEAVDLHPYGSNQSTIITKEGLVSEQFREDEIEDLLGEQDLSLEGIKRFNDVAFQVIAEKE